MKVEGSKQRSVAAISERGDDQPRRVPKVLITISQRRVDHSSYEVFFLPVVAKLTQPLEVHLTGHPWTTQHSHYAITVCEWELAYCL